MKKVNAMVSLAVVALLSLMMGETTMAQQPPDNVQGNWTIYSTNIEDGATVIKHVQIAQYGNRITGYFEGPYQSGPIQGEVNIHHVRFSTVTKNVLTFRGEIYGDTMSGEYGIHGKHAQWQAQRTSGGPQEAPQPAASYSQPELIPTTMPPAPSYAQQASTPQSYAPQAAEQSAPAYGTQTYSSSTASTAAPGYSAPAPAPLTSDQLNALVAPVALYPDSLVAQVLAASTLPNQITDANYWLSQNTNLTGAALAQAVDQQPWDPSVKALTQFPTVLVNLAKNLAWTSSLGQAYEYQGSDVMAAVQLMRAKAQAAGTLQSNAQTTVTQPSSGVIVIQPANPQVVYVPQYNPTIVYGAPLVVPYYTPPVAFATATVSFGAGISIGAFFGGQVGFVGGGFGWGWHAWACNWGGGGTGNAIIFNHNTYINNNIWARKNYNGYHPWGPGPSRSGGYVGPDGYYHPDPGYHPGTDTHYGPNGAYHPNGYFGPDGGWHEDKNAGQQGPNGGNNGNHGLIGGNGGAEHAGQQVPNGGNNGNHGLIGGNNGVRNPNAGMNGPGVTPAGGYHNDNQNNNHALGASSSREQEARTMSSSRSRMSGDGSASRMESRRGRDSMAGRRPEQHVAREHAPAEHHPSGGGHRR